MAERLAVQHSPTTPTIPTFEEFVPPRPNGKCRERYNPQNEVLLDDDKDRFKDAYGCKSATAELADTGGKRVLVVGDAAWHKSILINEILGIPRLSVPHAWRYACKQVPISYQYLEDYDDDVSDDDIEIELHFLPLMIPVIAIHATENQADMEDVNNNFLSEEEVDELVCPDVKTYHEALLHYLESKSRILKEVKYFIKSPALAGGATVVDIPELGEGNARNYQLADRYLIVSKAHSTLGYQDIYCQLWDAINAARNGARDVTLVLTCATSDTLNPGIVADMIEKSYVKSYLSLTEARAENYVAYERLMDLIYDIDGNVKDDPEAQRAKIESMKRDEYDNLLEYHVKRACTFSMVDFVRKQIQSIFQDRNNASIEVRIAEACEHRKLVNPGVMESYKKPLFSAAETGLPYLRRMLRNL